MILAGSATDRFFFVCLGYLADLVVVACGKKSRVDFL
jgi:hypothetical protein